MLLPLYFEESFFDKAGELLWNDEFLPLLTRLDCEEGSAIDLKVRSFIIDNRLPFSRLMKLLLDAYYSYIDSEP